MGFRTELEGPLTLVRGEWRVRGAGEKCGLDRGLEGERLEQGGVTGPGGCAHLCVCALVCTCVCPFVRVRDPVCVCVHLCVMELAGGSGHSQAGGSEPVM